MKPFSVRSEPASGLPERGAGASCFSSSIKSSGIKASRKLAGTESLSASGHSADPCRQCPTRQVCIAAKLPTAQLAHLPAWLQVSGVYAPGQVLYRAGEAADRQFHVRSGMFKSFVINAQGDEFVTGFHMAGDIIGSVTRAGSYVDSAVAIQTATLCELNVANLQNDSSNGAFTVLQALVAQMTEQARLSMSHQLALCQTSAQVRFAAFCMNYAQRLAALNRCNTFLPTPMSRTDLANYLGMTLESLSRLISKLNSSGVIAAARDHIEVRQPVHLAKLARQASCE